MSGDNNFVIKPYLTDRISGPFGLNEGVIALRDQRVRVIHRVDSTEAGDIAVLDIDARDIIFAFVLRLGAVLLEVVDGLGGDQQARILLRRDLCLSFVQTVAVRAFSIWPGKLISTEPRRGLPSLPRSFSPSFAEHTPA